MVEIKAGRKFLQRRLLITVLSLPLFIYAVPDVINDLFGYDLTGGLMGERDPVGKGIAVLLGLPVILYCLVKFTFDLKAPPTIARISEEWVEICLPWRSVIDKSNIKEIFISDIQCEIIGFEDSKPIIKIPIDRFDCGAAQLATAFDNKEYSVMLEMAE